jgi:hypothetical protein
MDNVKIVCGSNPQYFPFGTTNALNTIVKGSSGTQTATVSIYGTNDPNTAGLDQNQLNASGPVLNFAIGTTSGSATVTQKNGYFKSSMTGYQVYAPGVPNGTTFTYSNPTSGTLSANATATATTVSARMQDSNWVLLGTIPLTGTLYASDGFATASSWKWTYANVSAISGTGATVTVIQGV